MTKIAPQRESDVSARRPDGPMPTTEFGESTSAPRRLVDAAVLRWALPAAVGLLTLLTFSPALRNGFVNWDDDVNIVENSAFRGFSAEHLGWMFSTTLGGHYQPFTWLSFAVDNAVWGSQAFGYHLSNVVLHVICAVLFCLVAHRLLVMAFDSGDRSVDAAAWWCAAFAAAVFAVHPLRVESVAWVTERRDVLSGAMLMGCVLAYLQSISSPRRSVALLAVSVALFAASLLAKAIALGFPVVLLVMDFYPARRVQQGRATASRVIAEKIPFLALSVAAGFAAVAAQRSAETMRSLAEFDVVSRAAVFCRGLTHYLYKFLNPRHLSPLYLMPERTELLGTGFLVSVVVLAGVVALAIMVRQRYPAILTALFCYVVLFAPISGIAQSGRQLAADRYTYLALLPVALLLAGGMLLIYVRRTERGDGMMRLKVFRILACVFVAALAPLAMAQTTVWKDSLQLWKSALDQDRNNTVALVNFADALSERGQFDIAAEAFSRAASLDPSDHRALNGKGASLLRLNRPVEALEALQLAVKLAPDRADYRCNLGYVLAGFQRFAESAEQYEAALRVAPGMGPAYGKLSAVYQALGRYADAAAVLAAGLKRRPDDGEILGHLAWLLATCPDEAVRDGKRALELAERLCEATDFNDPLALDTLAAAQAACGRFEQAVKTIQLGLTQGAGKFSAQVEAQMRVRQELYAGGKPYLE